jgi:undecaprenyl-diphosphatase
VTLSQLFCDKLKVVKAFDSAVLGIVEGVTEYLPISSTGHLILTEHLLGISESESAKVFAIAIQLGAIAAVVVLYWQYFLQKTNGLFKQEKKSLQFFTNLFVAFFPVAVVGLIAGKWIKQVLFSPMWVLLALVVGGVLMILAEMFLKSHKGTKTIDTLTPQDAFVVGLCQICSLWPGFSRAMSTILGGRLVGLSAKDASEFSFFLAVPTLGAATAYEMLKALKNGTEAFNSEWWTSLAIGMLVSFVSALIVIKMFLAFLRKYPLTAFGYYRIILASVLYFFLK